LGRGVVASTLLFKSVIDSTVQVKLSTTYLFMVSSRVHKDNAEIKNKKKENGQRKGYSKAQGRGE
jgi:hypothetical protein